MYMYIFGNWYNSFSLTNCVSHFLLSFFVQNNIKVSIPLTLRENAISVCCFFLKCVLQHQFFQSAIHAFFRGRCFFPQSIVHVLIVNPPPFKLKVCRVRFKGMIQKLSVVSLFELHIINSLNSSFSYKDRNIRGIVNWDLKPFMLDYIPTTPTFQIPVIYLFQKQNQYIFCTQKTRKQRFVC